MTELTDIAPIVETVKIDGKAISVPGISAYGIALLVDRFPDQLDELMSGKAITVARILKIAGPAIGPILAAGCGLPGDEKAERIFARYDIDAQLDLLEAILRRTLRGKGIGPFVEKIGRVMSVMAPPKAEDNPIRLKVRDSQKPSKLSSASAMQAPMSG